MRRLAAWVLGGLLIVAGVLGAMGYRAGWFSNVVIAQDQPLVSPQAPLEETIQDPLEEAVPPLEPDPSLEDLVADAKAADEAQNYGNAFFLFHQAAEQESAEAQFRLGTMYLEGRGVAPDTTVAETWLRRADQQGYADAEQALAQREETETDRGVDETDTTEAPEGAAEADTDETVIPLPRRRTKKPSPTSTSSWIRCPNLSAAPEASRRRFGIPSGRADVASREASS